MVNCNGCKFHQTNGMIHICQLFQIQTNGSVDDCNGKIPQEEPKE